MAGAVVQVELFADALHALSLHETPADTNLLEKLVDLTRDHPRYNDFYNFPSFREGWMRPESSLRIEDSKIKLVSLDCEMVGCRLGEDEIVQVCVADHNHQTLLNTIVKPSKQVLEYRTDIHGITRAEMESAPCSQKMAQEKVLEILTPGTIIVGHSLDHDLKGLKIDYRRVIDTALIFKPAKGTFRFGLNRLCAMKLGYDSRAGTTMHNCLDDAVIPMKLVQYVLDRGLLELKVPEELNKLFVHGIPSRATVVDIRRLFQEKACTVGEIRRKSRFGTTLVQFSTEADANEAFCGIQACVGKDVLGRPQKTVYLNSGGHLKVRKLE